MPRIKAKVGKKMQQKRATAFAARKRNKGKSRFGK